jgi:hypothetical protein
MSVVDYDDVLNPATKLFSGNFDDESNMYAKDYLAAFTPYITLGHICSSTHHRVTTRFWLTWAASE